MAARATSLGSDSSRQSHSSHYPPNCGGIASGSAECWGAESGSLTTRLPDPTPAMSAASGVPMAARATSLGLSQGRQSHPPTTHPNAAASLAEALNVGGSELETQNTHLPLPLPQPAGPRNGALDGVTTATTGHLSSSSSAELAAMLESAAQTLASSDACVLESQNFRDSVEETASPTVTPLPPSSSSARLPVKQQEIILATFKSRFPAFSGMSIDQQKVILAACKNPEEAKELLAKLLLPLVIPLEPEYAGQVVSMFLDLDNKNICELIQSPPMLSSKVAEAMEVLPLTLRAESQVHPPSRNVHFAPVPSTESPSPSSPALAPPPGLGHLRGSFTRVVC